MLNPDFSERTYTAEVIRLRSKADDAIRALSRLIRDSRRETHIRDDVDKPITLMHGFLPSTRQYHRVDRTITDDGGARVRIPRRVSAGRGHTWLYDVLIAHCSPHIVVAVPFHDIGERFFVEADGALAGTGTRYEKLDITSLVVRLGRAAGTSILPASSKKLSLSITRCHLAYTSPVGRNRNLQQVQLTGADLGTTAQYQDLIAPVISPTKDLIVTPVILGFALLSDGVRKSSAITDRHGNFKVWVSPGLRRLTRLFALLEAMNSVEDVVSTTPNVPILQSQSIRGAEIKL